MTTKKSKFIILIMISVLVALLLALNLTSGADDINIATQIELEKYANYSISEDDKGTIVQYHLEMGMEYLGDYEEFPVKESEILINLNQIDGKYPYDVKVIAKGTQATNGKGTNAIENYQYDANSGSLVVKANNQNEDGEKIYNDTPDSDARDKYSIICYYDTYTSENLERELACKIYAKAILFENDREISNEQEFTTKVAENTAELTSIHITTQEIYNGKIKSNIINNTEFDTEYVELNQIVISKKEAQQKLQISQGNTFVKVNENDEKEDLANNGNLVIKNTKISKANIEKVLGEDGTIEILDAEGNSIALINKDSEWEEDGTLTIYYENAPENIMVKTSEIKSEGILYLKNTKEIKNTLKDIENTEIKTVTELTGINEEKLIEEVEKDGEITQEEKIEEKIAFEYSDEKIIDIKDSQTSVTLDVNNTDWTNKQQNEILFNIALNSNNIKYNMFKNPTLRIELPSEVEKVILGNSTIIYGNGLELQGVQVETNANGSLSIVANITGTQTSYNENSLGLTTEVQIPATIILKKDIESVKSNVNLVYTNQYTLNGEVETGNQIKDIQIESYNENKQEDVQEKEVYNIATMAEQYASEEDTVKNIDKLQTEILLTKGDTNLSDEDIVYEGEYIKYNIKVTNTANEAIDNVKIVGIVPEGTTYGELEADYNNYMGKYAYNFDETVRSKTIEVGTLKAGETYSAFYEVRVNDLQEGETEKNILTNIKTYANEIEANSYELTNVAKESDVKVFLGAFLDNSTDRWNYSLKVESEENKEVTVKIVLPETYELDLRVEAGALGDNEVIYLEADENNVVTDTIETNKEYWYQGTVDNAAIRDTYDEGPVTLLATATAEIDGKVYNSNENRIEYEFQSVSVTMTSENEGEEVEYEDEINYEIVIKNTGKTNLNQDTVDIIPIDVIDYLPEEVDPVSLQYEYWEETEEGWVKQEETLDISTEATDKDGNRLPNVELTLNIPSEESITIKVKTTAEYVFEKTKIENSATVTGETINTKTSNVVTHTILPFNDQEVDESEENPSEPDQPEDPTDPSEPSDEKYSIQGIAWLDENKDGQRQATEGKLSDIEIMLFDAEKSNIISNDIKTNSEGEYEISDLEAGKYIVLFKYNTETYRLTEYQRVGVSNSLNSDANKKSITLQGQQMTVGATDTISLDASISNIDIGLIENEVCDLKLDKYVSAISVTTSNGTKQYSYNNEKLAKVEIKSKEIEGATVVVEYKIVITNEGELPTSVDRIIDYIPDGMTFSSELNKSWGTQTNGQLVNTSTVNQTIKPGESIEVELVLTKSMTSNSTGTFTNIAEIGGISNSLEISDIDSTPANKSQGEDDYSQADVIIAVSTGGIVFAGITIIMVVILIIIFSILSKKGLLKIKNVSKISKISIFVLIFSALIFAGKDVVWSSGTEYTIIESVKTKTFDFLENSSHRNDYGSICFESGELWEAHCINAGVGVHEGSFTFEKAVSLVNMGSRTDSSPKVDIQKKDNENGVNIKSATVNGQSYWVYGPLTVECEAKNTGRDSNAVSYVVEAWGPMGDEKTVTICKANGQDRDNVLSGEGKKTFYIRVPKSEVDSKQGHYGLAEIKLTAKADGVKETIKKKKGYLIYKPEIEDCQWVQTTERHAVYEYGTEKEVEVEDSVTWTGLNVWITITKVDEDNANIKMANVEFYVKRGVGTYLRLTDDNGNFRTGLQGEVTVGGYDKMEWVDNAGEATIFKTDSNGKLTIKNLKGGISYYLIEKENPNAGYSNKLLGDNVDSRGICVVNKNQPGQKGQIYDFILKNEKEKGNLQIIKQDTDSAKKLSGVSFRVKTSDNKYIIATAGSGSWIFSTTTSNVSQATTFTTDGNGAIKINEMIPGNYSVEETSVGSWSNIYEIDDNYITWQSNTGSGSGRTATVNVTSQTSATSYVTVTYKNKKKYVDLSGYVWEDKIAEAKGGQRDNLKGLVDALIPGIVVELKDSSGNVVRTTKTDSNGKYIFNKIEINNISKYYIDFTYNGMAYQAVTKNLNSNNGSKASEYSGRAYMNMLYDKISKDKADGTRYGPGGTENTETELKYTYNEENHKSYLDYECTDSTTYGLSENAPVNNVASKYTLTASTMYAYGKLEYIDYGRFMPGYLSEIKSPDEIRKGDVSEISNINLGLYRRDQPDLAVKKDIESAKVQINGQTHIYKYADRFNNIATYGDGFETTVKFGQEYGNMSYTRALYASDIEYTGDNQLSVNVTYRISIANQSTTKSEKIKVIVNQLADYYDTKYEYVGIGTSINEDGSIKDKIADTKVSEELAVDNNSQYKKRLIDLSDKVIAAGTSLDIYVEMRVKPNEIIKLVDSSESDIEVKLDNIAEITSYSTKYEAGGKYAGIDTDSNPGTTVPGNRQTYEDDTDSAPGLKLVLQEERTISGKVFLDESNKIQVQQGNITGDIRQGNGQLDDNETGIENVQVRLVRIVDNNTYETAKIYDYSTKQWVDAIYNTGSNGEYSFGGVIPDNYYLEFIWGDKTYRVQDYKATVIDETSSKAKSNNEEWYKDEFKKTYTKEYYDSRGITNYIEQWNNSTNKEYRTSDVTDNYALRENIDAQTNLITNNNQDIIENYNENSQIELENGEKADLITKMNSSTDTFKVNVEYIRASTNIRDEYQLNDDGTIKLDDNGNPVKKEEFKNAIESIDFGIVKRAEQELSMVKQINTMKVELANGQVIVNLSRDENGELTGEMKNTVYMQPSENTIPNNGFVKLELDNELMQGATLEIEYEIQVNNSSEIEYLTKDFYMYGKGHGENEDNVVMITPSEIIDYLDGGWVINSNDNSDWSRKDKIYLKSKVNEDVTNSITDQIILSTEALKDQKIKPSDSKSLYVKVSKVLSTTDEISLDNEAESIIIEKTGGAKLESTPGNYIPGNSNHEADDGMGETVIVTPSTGENLAYTLPITCIVAALTALGIGIILIKKKVLKKDK